MQVNTGTNSCHLNSGFQASWEYTFSVKSNQVISQSQHVCSRPLRCCALVVSVIVGVWFEVVSFSLCDWTEFDQVCGPSAGQILNYNAFLCSEDGDDWVCVCVFECMQECVSEGDAETEESAQGQTCVHLIVKGRMSSLLAQWARDMHTVHTCGTLWHEETHAYTQAQHDVHLRLNRASGYIEHLQTHTRASLTVLILCILIVSRHWLSLEYHLNYKFSGNNLAKIYNLQFHTVEPKHVWRPNWASLL